MFARCSWCKKMIWPLATVIKDQKSQWHYDCFIKEQAKNKGYDNPEELV